jgi:hypothetical protein
MQKKTIGAMVVYWTNTCRQVVANEMPGCWKPYVLEITALWRDCAGAERFVQCGQAYLKSTSCILFQNVTLMLEHR